MLRPGLFVFCEFFSDAEYWHWRFKRASFSCVFSSCKCLIWCLRASMSCFSESHSIFLMFRSWCTSHWKKGVLKKGKKVSAFATSSKPSQTVYYILINLHIYPKYPFFKGSLDVFPIRSLFASFFEPPRFHFLPFIQSRRTHDGCFVKPNPSLIGDWESMILSRKKADYFKKK